MDTYLINGSTLTGLADALRKVNVTDRKYTPEEMIEAVTTILESATYILVDEDGNEFVGVCVDQETVFDATANDIRLGTVAATASGVTTGTKEIPAYHTTEGQKIIEPGEPLEILLFSDRCQYSKLQVIVCEYNANISNSVSAVFIAVNDKVYAVGSTVELASVTVDAERQSINLGIKNDGESRLLIRYMTFKEEY